MNVMMNVGIGVLALAWILYRQLTARQVRQGNRTIVILGAIGLFQAYSYLKATPVPPAEIIGALCGLVVAAVIAWPRARSTKVWQDRDGQWWRKGTALTVALWFVAAILHFATALLVPRLLGAPHGLHGFGFEQATIMLYLAVSLGCQGLFVSSRVDAIGRDEVRASGRPSVTRAR